MIGRHRLRPLFAPFWLYQVLTPWRPLLPCGYSYKASCARPGTVIYNFWHPGTQTLSPERQSDRMSTLGVERLTSYQSNLKGQYVRRLNALFVWRRCRHNILHRMGYTNELSFDVHRFTLEYFWPTIFFYSGCACGLPHRNIRCPVFVTYWSPRATDIWVPSLSVFYLFLAVIHAYRLHIESVILDGCHVNCVEKATLSVVHCFSDHYVCYSKD